MQIGIVTDIHDEVDHLAQALATLRAEKVDAIVSLGDTTDLFGAWHRADQIAVLLREAGVIGVWGNHDHGLCRDVSDKTRSRVSQPTLDYMAAMQPRLELESCHFSHVEPWLDAEDPANLWVIEGKPEEPENLRKSFAASSFRVAFMGHFHRWLAADESGQLPWKGTETLTFEAHRRYLVVVGPLFQGDFAILNTERWTLEPRHLPTNESRS